MNFCLIMGLREEESPMFSDETLEKIFVHEEMQKIPIGAQSTAVHAFEEILENIMEVNSNATIQSLFPTDDE